MIKKYGVSGYEKEQEVDKKEIQHSEYATFNEDGSYEFIFISSEQGNIIKQVVEYGDWGLVADVHFTITQSELVDEEYFEADLSQENNYNAYQVLQLNNHYCEYQDLASKEIYLLKRTMTTVGNC